MGRGALDGVNDGEWAVFAEKVVAERDERQQALEILGRAIGEIIPDARASGSAVEHATSIAAQLRSRVTEERRERDGWKLRADDLASHRDGAERDAAAARAETAKLLALIERGHEENAAIAAKIEAMESTLSDISESLGVSADADADLAGIVEAINEVVPQYVIDADGNEASTLEERVDCLIRERDEKEERRHSLAQSRRAWIDAATSVLAPDWSGTPDDLKAALTKMRDEHAEWSHRPDADLYGRNLDALENLQARAEKAEAACERLRKALKDVSTWREDCHAHDADMGYEPRDFDEDEIACIERHAVQALEREDAR